MHKILHIITDLNTGGAEMMLYKLLKTLDRTRFKPAVISLLDKGTLGASIEALDIPVFEVGMQRALPRPIHLWKLRRLVKECAPDLIQSWMHHANLAALFARFPHGQKLPVVWNIRQSLYDIRQESPLTRNVIRLCARTSIRPEWILYNTQIGAQHHQQIGFSCLRWSIIPNGFDLTRFKPDPRLRSTMRSQLGLPDDSYVIGGVGRFHPMKDHKTWLESARLIAEYRKDVYFVLAGNAVEIQNPIIGTMLDKVGIDDRVRLLGERDDIADLLPAFDIFLSSSSCREGFPNVVGEAMASGIPCVVTDVGDSAPLVADTGKVVQPKSPMAICRAVMDLLELSNETRSQLGNRARARIQENYSLINVAKQYMRLHEEIIHNVRNCRPH